MPCYRYIVTDASLFREQRAPYQVYSRRWQSMDIVNIPAGDWASAAIRTIIVAPVNIDAPFQFHVREFIPADGDLLEEQWMTPTGRQSVPIPKFAVAEMHEAAAGLKEYIERNVSNFIAVIVGPLDQLLWETYTMAFRHIGNANTPEERSLLKNVFLLWVTSRLTSNPVYICGDDKLGGCAVYSADSLHNGKVPMPVIMTAQFECINYTMFLRPWSKAVLKQLNELVLAKRRDYWLTIYYAMFVLLHSCSMTTRRDAETAVQYDMKVMSLVLPGCPSAHTRSDAIRQPRQHQGAPQRGADDASALSLSQQGRLALCPAAHARREAGISQGGQPYRRAGRVCAADLDLSQGSGQRQVQNRIPNVRHGLLTHPQSPASRPPASQPQWATTSTGFRCCSIRSGRHRHRTELNQPL